MKTITIVHMVALVGLGLATPALAQSGGADAQAVERYKQVSGSARSG